MPRMRVRMSEWGIGIVDLEHLVRGIPCVPAEKKDAAGIHPQHLAYLPYMPSTAAMAWISMSILPATSLLEPST